jgi:mannose-6-phosphate isomerase-like protein (cupin superfamily)
MPKVSKESATGGGDYGPVSDRNEELDDYTVNFVTFHEDVDGTPLMKGLPDDRCQSPHWGYVIKGRIHFQFADHDEVVETGDAFYLPPGHIPVKHEPGTQIVQFSPTEELRQTDAAIMRNMQAMQAGAAG